MTKLTLKTAAACRYDAVSLGEVMLRLDPGDRRIHTTRSFDVWEGGGEYNVARGLRRCFRLRTAIVTALVDNPVGRLVEDLILQGGVDTSLIRWTPDDGAGRSVRNGLNFTERGFGARGAVGCSDRGNTAISKMRPSDVDWDGIFGAGVRWFHTGGIFAALSDDSARVAETAIRSAKAHGVVVSYDLNYRHSLWQSRGGQQAAQELNRTLVAHADVLFSNEGQLKRGLGLAQGNHDRDPDKKDFASLITQTMHAFPNLSSVAATVRGGQSAGVNSWGAKCYHEGALYEVPDESFEILDRVGGGDSFAAGFIFGILNGETPLDALKTGVAHGALSMTTPGDTSSVTQEEVRAFMAGKRGGTSR